jgi:spore germination cell wall hydrolase CwlJ-like protein
MFTDLGSLKLPIEENTSILNTVNVATNTVSFGVVKTKKMISSHKDVATVEKDRYDIVTRYAINDSKVEEDIPIVESVEEPKVEPITENVEEPEENKDTIDTGESTTDAVTVDDADNNDDNDVNTVETSCEEIVDNNENEEIVETVEDDGAEEDYTYFEVCYNDEDYLALCNAVENEVRGLSCYSKFYVANVIINRTISPEWEGDSFYDVVTAPGQFSNSDTYIGVEDYATEDTIECVNYVLETGIDFTDGATMFYNPDLVGVINWFESHELVIDYEGHRYFR